MSEQRVRSSLEVTWSVWSALFIREALQRTMADRLAWLWMLAQPMAQILFFVGIRSVIGKLDSIAGAPYIPWLVVGMMVYMLFSEGMVRSLGAIDASRGLLSYRQVKPLDPIIIRITLEAFLKTIVFFIIVIVSLYFGLDFLPKDILKVIAVWLLAWFFGLSVGVFFSAITQLMPGLTTIIRISTMPLYFLSGVMLPINYAPHKLQEVLTYNPVLHLVEVMRAVWFAGYHPVNGVYVFYVICWTLGFLFLGLLLHKRYEYWMIAE